MPPQTYSCANEGFPHLPAGDSAVKDRAFQPKALL